MKDKPAFYSSFRVHPSSLSIDFPTRAHYRAADFVKLPVCWQRARPQPTNCPRDDSSPYAQLTEQTTGRDGGPDGDALMKLPKKKEEEIEKQGGRKLPPRPGGGAAGRAYQFELEHGLDEAEPAADSAGDA